MTIRIVFALFFLVPAFQAIAQTAPALGSGRLVEWIPRSEVRLEAAVYLGRNLLPAVGYSTDFVRRHPPEYVKFSVVRQDFVAYIATEMLRKANAYSSSLDYPELTGLTGVRVRTGEFIPESSVYSYQSLQGMGDLALDCLAYQVLSAKEREELAEYARRRIADKPQIPGSVRTLSESTISWGKSETCVRFSANFLK